MNRQIIAQDVADHLVEAELAIAQSMAKAAKLMEVMVLAQLQLKVASTVAEPAMRRVAAAMATLGQAHSEMVSAHNRMDQIQRKIGLTPVAGGGMEKEDDGPVLPPHGADLGQPVTGFEAQI
ncbi:hypothetical protein QO010_001872 [Caulobacter ginsengisoli]|uniref:Uncharacterized protein n=1 Tax=Caulobacter ginsengisoli TaxID=400775 RepID=A0ABU0IRX3_9CAUL|nr:hypothetical protein [Caulobacter ginsengisoli]MDQ0464101.1 hypothetical protein [Caulobacter ginsengisoli]